MTWAPGGPSLVDLFGRGIPAVRDINIPQSALPLEPANDKKSFLRGILGNFLFSLSQGLQASANAPEGRQGPAAVGAALAAPQMLEEIKRRRIMEAVQVQMQQQQMEAQMERLKRENMESEARMRRLPLQEEIDRYGAAADVAKSQEGQVAPVRTEGFQYPAETSAPGPTFQPPGGAELIGSPYQNEIQETYDKLPAVPHPGIPSIGVPGGQFQPRSEQELRAKSIQDRIIAMRMAAEEAAMKERASLPFFRTKEKIKAENRQPKYELMPPDVEAQQKRIKKAGAQPQVELTDNAIDMAADFFASTGQLPPSLGRGGQAQRAIMNRAAQKYPTLDIAVNKPEYEANKASLAAIQKQYDAMSAFERTIGRNMDIMMEQAALIPDTGSQWLNEPIRTVSEKLLGNADIPAFRAARMIDLTEIAKIVTNPSLAGVLTNEAREEILKLSPDSVTMNQLIKVSKVLRRDTKNRDLSMKEQIEAIKARLGRKQPGESPASGAAESEANEFLKKKGLIP